jgi:hypothetical protein
MIIPEEPIEPMVTRHTTDAAIKIIAKEIWPVIQVDPVFGKAAFSYVCMALRALLQGDMPPADAVRVISTIGLSISGLGYEEVPGTRVHPRQR